MIRHVQALGEGTAPPVLPVAFAARVTKDVTDPDQFVDVDLVNTEARGVLSSESAPWPDKGSLPQRGDDCLVVVDDAGRPWVVAWNLPGWGTA